MATLIESAEVNVSVNYRLVGLLDVTCDDGEKPQSLRSQGRWVSTTPGNVYLEDLDENPVSGGPMRLQTWDGPADFDPSEWDRHDVIEMDFPSGRLGVDMITAGAIPNAYQLPEGRRWKIRLAWRTLPNPDPWDLPEALILVQFWPAESADAQA